MAEKFRNVLDHFQNFEVIYKVRTISVFPLFLFAAICSAASPFSVDPYSAVKFPTLVVSQVAAGHIDALAVLSNNSDVPIMAVKMYWVDLTGKQLFTHDTSAFRQNAARGLRPIVEPHSATLLKPEDEYMTKYLVPGAKIEVDAVIFADGRVSGPDTTHYAEDQLSEYQAVKDILRRVKAGETPADIKVNVQRGARLRAEATRIAGSHPVRDWGTFYAAQLTPNIPAGSEVSRRQAIAAFVARMENLPPMPTFYREDQKKGDAK